MMLMNFKMGILLIINVVVCTVAVYENAKLPDIFENPAQHVSFYFLSQTRKLMTSYRLYTSILEI